jgi:hypothetical protein
MLGIGLFVIIVVPMVTAVLLTALMDMEGFNDEIGM